jgi:tyrosyl-tRNA synthetase
MVPILEGLDGVQKMSKSLNNAIGIHEPASEMYGKLMSISDELMWKYWTLLTDLRQSEIAQMRAEVEGGKLHPMQAKKNLAHAITADFHSAAEADAAAENWAKQFQQRAVADDLEEVAVSYAAVAGAAPNTVRMSKLLAQAGLAASASEATRKLGEGAVRVDTEVHRDAMLSLEVIPAKLTLRLGKRAKAVTVTQ